MKSEKKDFINGLPDELICHILSFLPTKNAVSTCILARRWKRLFAFVPNLDFDDSFYLQYPPMTYGERRKDSESLMRFVDSVLHAKVNAPLKRFHVKCEHIVDQYWLTDWIPKVLKRGVLDIDLHIPLFHGFCQPSFYRLPSMIFVRLKIKFNYGFKIDVEGDVCLPKLKTLHIDIFEIKTSIFNKLLSGCHTLEELVLVNLVWDSSEAEPFPFTVSIPTLKRLKFCRSQSFYESVSLSIDTPNLVYLEYSDTIADRYQQVSFDSLVEARLRLRKTSYPTETDKSSVTNLLMGIHSVKILDLYVESFEVLTCCREIIPVFDNLIQLTIKTTPDLNWDPLPTLLKNCPNLETLVFEGLHHKYTNRCGDEDGCLCKYQEVRTCLSSSPVKVLKILKFGKKIVDDNVDDDEEAIEKQIEQVKHFLETMRDLEQMILYYNTPNDENVMKVFKKLEELPRVASAKCSVQIISANLSLSLTKRGTLL